MEKKIFVFLTVVLVLMIAAVLFIPAPKKNKTEPTFPVTNLNLKVFNLNPNQAITSPLVILGEARGWYFEGSFPVKIQDEKGNILAEAPAQAKSDWMTDNFVPFEAKLEFKTPLTQKGVVVLERDDPSGLGQNLETARIPITFN